MAAGLIKPLPGVPGNGNSLPKIQDVNVDSRDDQIAHLSIVARTGNSGDWSKNQQFARDTFREIFSSTMRPFALHNIAFVFFDSTMLVNSRLSMAA